ncbi:MAG TPA: hypothetical protein DCE00_02120 [Firmicutes bacterium]|jgi:hypothetical protein|nr:DUF4912 domain-containing protein [Bacillota bacterium]HAA37650.1 hypothetical protein [Bacillota bacterium]
MHTPDRHELNAGWTLPHCYGVDRLVLLPRDPHKLVAYWEITPALEESFAQQFPEQWFRGHSLIKLKNIMTGTVQDFAVNHQANNWYLEVNDADQSYYAQLGRRLDDGTFVVMLTSNTVSTPRSSLSSVIDPRWRLFAFWQRRFYRRLSGYSSYELFSSLDADPLAKENYGD